MTGGIRSQDAGSPLELFFDLVFIFAVSELSHHLLNQLSWLLRDPGPADRRGGWAFVVPLLVIQAGRSILMVVAGGLSFLLPAYAALGLVATLLLTLVAVVVRERVPARG
jgi:hypothetical protein